MVETSASPRANHGSWGRTVGITSLVAVVLGLLVLAFAWPNSRVEADGMSIAVTGDAELVDEFTHGFAGGLGDVVDLVQVADKAAAVGGIESRDFIGAVVLTQASPEVLTASAAGQVPQAFMTELASQLQRILDVEVYAGVTGALQGALQSGAGTDPTDVLSQLPETLPAITVTDVVPLSDGDSNGVGLVIAPIPLTVGALLAGIAIAFLIAGVWPRIAALIGLAFGGGLLLAIVLDTWLGVYPGGLAMVWLALGLSVLATSGLFVGLHSVLGRIGIGLAALLTLFAGMPWAAFAVPYQFLPAGLGHIGQWLIPGATVSLTRTVSYFPDATSTGSWWVLITWAALGLILTILGATRRRQA